MRYAYSIVAYFVVVFAWAFTWNIFLFHETYVEIAGELLREPPIFPLGMTAIALQSFAMTAIFAMFYPKGEFRFGTALGLAAIVNVGSVAYGALVLPAKISMPNVTNWVVIELAYGVIATFLIALAMAAVWSRGSVEEPSDGD